MVEPGPNLVLSKHSWFLTIRLYYSPLESHDLEPLLGQIAGLLGASEQLVGTKGFPLSDARECPRLPARYSVKCIVEVFQTISQIYLHPSIPISHLFLAWTSVTVSSPLSYYHFYCYPIHLSYSGNKLNLKINWNMSLFCSTKDSHHA